MLRIVVMIMVMVVMMMRQVQTFGVTRRQEEWTVPETARSVDHSHFCVACDDDDMMMMMMMMMTAWWGLGCQ
jgi:hypothetical protein